MYCKNFKPVDRNWCSRDNKYRNSEVFGKYECSWTKTNLFESSSSIAFAKLGTSFCFQFLTSAQLQSGLCSGFLVLLSNWKPIKNFYFWLYVIHKGSAKLLDCPGWEPWHWGLWKKSMAKRNHATSKRANWHKILTSGTLTPHFFVNITLGTLKVPVRKTWRYFV